MSDSDNDWPEVVSNIQKLRKKCARLSRVMGKEGADAWVSCNLYLAVVQAVLLFQIGDSGDVSTYWDDNGRLSPPDDTLTERVASESEGRQELVLLPPLVTAMSEAGLE